MLIFRRANCASRRDVCIAAREIPTPAQAAGKSPRTAAPPPCRASTPAGAPRNPCCETGGAGRDEVESAWSWLPGTHGEAGAGHAFAQAAGLEEFLFELPELL